MPRGLVLLIAAATSVGLIAGGAIATKAANGPAASAKIDARVLADTEAGGSARFIVVLSDRANLGGAAALADRTAQGAAAVATLKRSALAQRDLTSFLRDSGAPVERYWIVNAIATTGGRELVQRLAARADVARIESDRARRGLKSESTAVAASAPQGVEWNVAKIGAPGVWAKGAIGKGIVYANADTGVAWDVPTLRSRYRGWNGTGAVHDYNWWDAVRSDLSGNGGNPCGFNVRAPCDDSPPLSHGTRTMGIAVGDDGQGNQIGVAPGTTWIACRNMDEGWGSPSTYLGCLQFFMAPTDLDGNNPDPSKRPDIVGNSYACPPEEGCSTGSLRDAVDNLRAAGVFMATAAGNEGRGGCSTVSDPPGIYDSAISVGATDANDGIAVFSSRGPVTADGSGRPKPDLVAPGVGIRSAGPNGFLTGNGTSYAAPEVGGAVALLWSGFPELRGKVDQTEDLLRKTAVPRTTTEGCGGDSTSAVPNNTYGSGRLDVLAAFTAQEAASPLELSAAPLTVVEGNSGKTRSKLTVSLSRPAATPSTIDFSTKAGTATAGADFVAMRGSVSIPAGERTAEIPVTVNGDLLREPDERFTIVLGAPQGVRVASGGVTVTIENDDTDAVRPRLTGLVVKPATAPPAATITARLVVSERAALECRTERAAGGGWKRTGVVRKPLARGRVTFVVPGHALAGRYRVRCLATDPAGNVSAPASVSFNVG